MVNWGSIVWVQGARWGDLDGSRFLLRLVIWLV